MRIQNKLVSELMIKHSRRNNVIMKNPMRTTCTNQNSDSPKAVIIMGAGDATGSAIANRFAREGFTACVSRRNIDKLVPLVKNIEDSGGKAVAFATDARKEDQVSNLTS
jgi:NADP-dependent 3-hydroxy acid dehydrogenase YdfG